MFYFGPGPSLADLFQTIQLQCIRVQSPLEQVNPENVDALILGRDPSHQPLTFRGEVIIQQSTGTVARIEIASDRMTPCNWLSGREGYILSWGQTNAGEQRLSELLHRGQSYCVHVAFSEMPPADSSLWFSSLGRAELW